MHIVSKVMSYFTICREISNFFCRASTKITTYHEALKTKEEYCFTLDILFIILFLMFSIQLCLDNTTKLQQLHCA